MRSAAPSRVVSRALDWDLSAADVLRLVRADPHPVALLGIWAGGSDIVASDPVRVSPAVLAGLPDRLRQAQRVFSRTGGLHAAGLFGPDGTLLVLREDVGRHNAVDKVAGWALRSGRLPLAGHVLLVSGRASFELAQKAVMIGVPVLAAVSAPSSLAASLAEESGLTLVGFLRGTTMNVYAGEHRVVTEDAPVAAPG